MPKNIKRTRNKRRLSNIIHFIKKSTKSAILTFSFLCFFYFFKPLFGKMRFLRFFWGGMHAPLGRKEGRKEGDTFSQRSAARKGKVRSFSFYCHALHFRTKKPKNRARARNNFLRRCWEKQNGSKTSLIVHLLGSSLSHGRGKFAKLRAKTTLVLSKFLTSQFSKCQWCKISNVETGRNCSFSGQIMVNFQNTPFLNS